MPDYDLIVVGAGPAGTTLAALVKKYDSAARVLIVEKSDFPRHHVGESLLPGMIPVLKELGVYDALNDAGFPRKIGVVFVWGKDRKPWDADFNNLNLEMVRKYGRALDAEFSWQVLRSRYDEILLQNARSCGVEARLGVRAVEALESKGKVRGLVVETAGGKRELLRCETLADCSGQGGFLSKIRRTRRYRDDLKNVAGYAYFKGAKWKFSYQGHPDKTKIFVCSVPEGWFWYIPLSVDTVSVGLVSKASYVKRLGVKDLREFFFKALKSCREISPLLSRAELLRGVDPAEPARDFFTAGDWSYLNEKACGEGWLAAGDAAFFVDPLLSSGVMMAHLSGHRAAYTLNTVRREKNPAVRRELWRDYDRFCKEAAGSFFELVRYWYHHDPNAKKWWKTARRAMRARSPLDLGDKTSFVAVASGLTYYFERAYTSQSLLFGSSGAEHDWQWEGTKLELKRWTRQILAIVETGFLPPAPNDARLRRAGSMVRLRELPDSWVPRWSLEARKSTTFLPSSEAGVLSPITRLDLIKFGAGSTVNPKRLLPGSYMTILELIDGKRTLGQVKTAVGARVPLPSDIIAGQVFRIVKDLAVLGALRFEKSGSRRKESRMPEAWSRLREAERALKRGDCSRAEDGLSAAIADGLGFAWVYALRGEARRHLGRPREARADLDRAARLNEAKPAEFEKNFERSWVEDRIRICRAALLLQLEDYAGARRDAEAALRANPRQSEALVLRAKASRALGELDQARADLEVALEVETSGKRGEG